MTRVARFIVRILDGIDADLFEKLHALASLAAKDQTRRGCGSSRPPPGSTTRGYNATARSEALFKRGFAVLECFGHGFDGVDAGDELV